MKKGLIIFKKWENISLLRLGSFLLGFSIGKKKSKQIKPLFRNAFVVIRNDKGVLYWPKTNFEKTVKGIANLMKKKPRYQIEILKQIEKKVREIKKSTTKIFKLALKKKSDQEMINLLQQVYVFEAELADLLAIPYVCILEFKLEIEDKVEEKLFFEKKNGFFETLISDVNTRIDQTLGLIIKEISRRTFYSVKQLNCALPNEMKDIFNKKGLKRYELDARHSLSLVQVTRNGILKITGGVEAKKFIKKNAK